MTRMILLMLSPLLAMSAPALAADAPSTRLVACGSESCLLISGRRADAAAPIVVNGHAVAPEGGRRWRVRIPVATVRAWSPPYARSVSVRVADVAHEARLPIGMLGTSGDLAMLVVRVK